MYYGHIVFTALLFSFDAVPYRYMKNVGKVLKVLLPNMLYVMCLKHALHRHCEESDRSKKTSGFSCLKKVIPVHDYL